MSTEQEQLNEAEKLADERWEDYLATLMVGEQIPPGVPLGMVETLVNSGHRLDCLIASFILKRFAGHY